MPSIETPAEPLGGVYIHDWRVERAFPRGPFVTGLTIAAHPSGPWASTRCAIVQRDAADALDPSKSPYQSSVRSVRSRAACRPGRSASPSCPVSPRCGTTPTGSGPSLSSSRSRSRAPMLRGRTSNVLTSTCSPPPTRRPPGTAAGRTASTSSWAAAGTTRWTGAGATTSCSAAGATMCCTDAAGTTGSTAATATPSCGARPETIVWPGGSEPIGSAGGRGRIGCCPGRTARRMFSTTPPRPRAATPSSASSRASTRSGSPSCRT